MRVCLPPCSRKKDNFTSATNSGTTHEEIAEPESFEPVDLGDELDDLSLEVSVNTTLGKCQQSIDQLSAEKQAIEEELVG